ncbi:rna-directed dna polymerase from mobile element jockey- hypothetical protein [Limosa lapponica baueri]|uniref:Rna-directed dna polymerase from mobile element jockey-like n=1 Tax=Limosa lapponica baueri TaxID=1758121 RepID=A0A2I0U3P5_LIMLA|nr:rna-directed dna polymerase from mobile element jockey- hypothetical protein [Limosa lapponica baueri]
MAGPAGQLGCLCSLSHGPPSPRPRPDRLRTRPFPVALPATLGLARSPSLALGLPHHQNQLYKKFTEEEARKTDLPRCQHCLPSVPVCTLPLLQRLKNKVKGKEEGPGNDRLVSLTSVPGIVMEQLILETIFRHNKDKKSIRSSQHGFIKEKSCLTALINLYDEMTGLVDKGRAVDNVYLDFSKAFDTVSRKILVDTL